MALNQICEKNTSGKVYIMNRTEKNAQDLAKRFPVQPVSFYEIRDVLGAVDLCICSSGAPHYILEPATIEKVMKLRGGRPLVFVDISMPRNIDPEIAEIENVTLIMLDDLDKFVDENLQKRQNAIREVEGIVQCKAREFFQKVEKLTLLPVPDRNGTLL
ncbi:MAG: hypothetical protein COT84_01715 [Chlamydiae bacterium CG10_big_fil_rev_8_21_14_0_10_35_9]|nr:MAG: hypothetical protein COT84_01715 [Chlamydiae bacterium CG10_big_fil_rev_8_21_14_0_10_35_9]